MLVMVHEYLKGICVTKVGLLGICLKETTKLYKEKKYKSLFVDHNTYLLRNILDTLWLQGMCQNKDTMNLVCNQELHQDHLNKIVDYLFNGYDIYFILEGRDIDPTNFPNVRVFKWIGEFLRTEYLDIWSSYIGAHVMDVRDNIFMPSVIKRVQLL